MYKRLIIVTLTFVIVSCSKKEETITNPQNYNTYLDANNSEDLAKINKELDFWNNRIMKDSAEIVDMGKSAGLQSRIFQTNADITQLKLAEKNLKKTAEKTAKSLGKSGRLLALAQNYVTQHRFKDAQVVVDSARVLGGPNDASTNLVQFDIAMELGNYDLAEEMLKKEADFSSYNYLIRLAKWEDYQGNLDKTIQHMETAQSFIENSNQKSLKLWVYTNLGDYYGHAGRIKEAYTYYLKALEIDPSNAYAKKGLAWINFSYENNPDEALRIISSIEKGTKSPDYDLFKAEIYELKGDAQMSKELTDRFIEKTSNPLYGQMYNSYLIDIYAGDKATTSKAVALAEREIKNRATPETYSLLSKAYLANGEAEKALKVAEEYVIGKTYEPVALLHTAQIYKALGMNDKVAPLKEELLEASYELGPLTAQDVKDL